MLTFQDFQKAENRAVFLTRLIEEHQKSEAVLTAMEAANWRGTRTDGMSEEMLTRAMQPVVEAIREIRFTLNLDKKALAEATASENRSAIAGYNRRIARGMGK